MWKRKDEELFQLAIQELVKIGFIEEEKVLDHVVIRVPKAYPAYFGTYNHFDEVRNYLNAIENLYLIGRNGMHRYNNQDHSMLTAIRAVENIITGEASKDNIWAVNIDADYHEEG